MAQEYEYNMRHIGTDNDEEQPIMNLERDFAGMSVLKVTGLLNKGAPKNIYTETYADADADRVYLPPEGVKYSATQVSISAIFIGNTCRAEYDKFVDYISGNKIEYWDNVRNRKAILVPKDAIEIDTDIVKGVPHLVVAFNFTNIYGKTFPLCAEYEK